MIERLVVLNFASGNSGPVCPLQRHRFFTLSTCQRTLVAAMGVDPSIHYGPLNVNFEKKTGVEAYRFLLETLCGLQSRLIGENEIVSQFKTAFDDYLKAPCRHNSLVMLLQKLFQDGKKIRTQHLLGIAQKTYSSIARKRLKETGASRVVILGSGQLAEDCVSQWSKRGRVLLCARNAKRSEYLQGKYPNVDLIPWEKRWQLSHYPYWINTIGIEGSVVAEQTFFDWIARNKKSDRLIVDLATPALLSSLKRTQVEDLKDSVVDLETVLSEGALHQQLKKEKIESARSFLKEISSKRALYFQELQKRSMASLRGAQIA